MAICPRPMIGTDRRILLNTFSMFGLGLASSQHVGAYTFKDYESFVLCCSLPLPLSNLLLFGHFLHGSRIGLDFRKLGFGIHQVSFSRRYLFFFVVVAF